MPYASQSGIWEGTAEAVTELTTAVTLRESNEELELVLKCSAILWMLLDCTSLEM